MSALLGISTWPELLQHACGLGILLLVAYYFGQLNRFVRLLQGLGAQKDSALVPGPPGIPFFGNLLQVPVLQPEQKFTAWAKEYGPLFRIRLGWHKQVYVINSERVAMDLLEKRGSKYSSRPALHVWTQLILPEERGFLAAPYAAALKQQRKSAHIALNPTSVKQYIPILGEESKVLLGTLLRHDKDKPLDPASYFRSYSFNTVAGVVFGKRASKGVDDPLLQTHLHITSELAAMSGGLAFLVDFLPILKYIPNPIVTRARKIYEAEHGAWMPMIAEIKSSESYPDCLAKEIVRTADKTGLCDEDIAFLCGALVGGGLETVGSTFAWLVTVLVNQPAVQERAWKELDDVVGKERLPEYDDLNNLPYVNAVIHEILRFRPPAPLAVPHATTEDDVYDGYVIPANSSVLLNLAAIHFDEEKYKDPFTFNPDRYLDDTYAERPHWTFGAGRRVCVGQHLAEKQLFMGIARLLWAFRFEAPLDETGARIPIDMDKGVGGLAFTPAPFEVHFVPRGSHVEALV